MDGEMADTPNDELVDSEALSVESLVEQLTKERDEFKDIRCACRLNSKIIENGPQPNSLMKLIATQVASSKVC